MENSLQIEEKPKGVSLVIAIAIVIAIAFTMVVLTTVNFLHSGAYTTVKQIQIGIMAVQSIADDDLDIKSPINANDIDNYAESINQRLKIINDYEDFGPEAVSDSSLML